MKLLSDEPAVQQARAHSGRIVRALNDLAALVQEAWDKRYDKVLRYKSWQAYCLGEFGSGETAIRARQIVTVMLRGEDLTEKAIAEQLGVSQPTVNRDLSEQADYSPSRGGAAGDQRRTRRREQYRTYRTPPRFPGGYASDMLDTERPPVPEAAPALASAFTRWTYRATVVPAANMGQPAIQPQPAAEGDQPAILDEPAATADQPANRYEPAAIDTQPAMGQLPAATAVRPATEPVPAADQDQPAIGAQPDQPAIVRERFLQGDTGGARAEIRRRVLAGMPVRREQIAAQFGVSEMFARQATAVEEERISDDREQLQIRLRLGPSEMAAEFTDALTGDTGGNCARELAAVRDRYPRVLTRSPWIADCLQLVIDTLSGQE